MTGSTSLSRSSSASRRRARHRSLRAALAGVAVAALATAGGAGGDAPPAWSTVMQELASGFNELEAELAEADAAGVRTAAASMSRAAAELPRLAPPAGTSSPDELGRSAKRVPVLLDEIGALAAEANLDGAEQAFAELRGTCVSCHQRFRAYDSARGHFPARGNTVSGRIALTDADGDALDDRSWVLLFLESTGGDAKWTHRRRNPKVSQHDRRFHPRVLPVVRGTTVDFPNDDSIFHNAFSVSKTKPFDLGTYKPGDSRSVTMTDTGLVKLYCNIHAEMLSSIVVLGNPWFALTDESGGFAITGVPDGEYKLRAWNDRGAAAEMPVELREEAWRTVELELEETRRVLPHKNKFGKPYPDKY